jgi:hypothetical protein
VQPSLDWLVQARHVLGRHLDDLRESLAVLWERFRDAGGKAMGRHGREITLPSSAGKQRPHERPGYIVTPATPSTKTSMARGIYVPSITGRTTPVVFRTAFQPRPL